MLTEIQLSHYFDRHDVGQDGQDYVLHVRHSQASRMVGAHARKNVCSWFYSEKMQHTISTESRTAERAFAVLCEFDDNVLEIWDQPEPVVIEKHTRGGYLKRSSYTPDFLVLRRDGPVLVEVKEKRAVEKLKCSVSKDWIERKDGEYDFLPPKRYFSDLGLGFEVFVASADQRFRVFNQELLLRARAVEATAVPIGDLDRAFEESFCWSLFDLRKRLKADDYTSLIQLIDQRLLFFDWDAELLSEPRGCYFVRQKELLQFVSEFQGPKIYQDNLLSPVEVGKMPSSSYAEEALERLTRIESGERSRSVRRWQSLVEQGTQEGLSPFQSLVPKWFYSGNRKRKINKAVDSFLLQYLMKDHAFTQGISEYRSYISYRVKAPGGPPCLPTGRKRNIHQAA